MLKKLTLLIVTAFLWSQSAMAATDGKKAEDFMTSIGQNVINLLTDKNISDQQRADQFREILAAKFNLKSIGKFVLGRYWKQASEEEKRKFLELFTETTVASYATRFKEYTTEKFEVTGHRVEGDGGVTVLTRITRPKGQPNIPIDWKIFEKDGEYRIYDVILDGISMGITQRSEFASVIQKGSGNIQAINKALEAKLVSYQR
jgi:phospholipid transport system substrate-binding protein